MDIFTAGLLEEDATKFNPLICNGFANNQLPSVEQYLDNILREASKTFPTELKYVGMVRMTPFQDFKSILAKSGRVEHDLSENTVFPVELTFEFTGRGESAKNITIPLALPYLKDGYLFKVASSSYRITPVLTDRVLSIEADKVFIRLLRNKIFVRRALHNVKIDGVATLEQILWVRLHYTKLMSNTTKFSSVAHYLLGELGYTEMCKKYLGHIPLIGTSKDLTYEKYPIKDYVHIESSGLPPKCMKMQKDYLCNTYKIVCPRDKWDPLTKNIMLGIIYTMDIFPEQISLDMLDEPRTWRFILAKILFKDDMSTEVLLKRVNKHYDSIDQYIDSSIKRRLYESGHEINDFFELLVLISKHFNVWILGNAEISSMVYNSYLDVIYYIMYEILAGVFMIGSNLDADNNNGKILTEKDVLSVLRSKLSKGKIYSLTNVREPNLAISLIESSTDNIYTKLSSPLETQSNGEGVKRKVAKRVKIGPRHHLRGPDLLVGSVLYLPKSAPTPKSRINPYCTIDPSTGSILPSKELKDQLGRLDDLLRSTKTDTGSDTLSIGDIATVASVED